MVKPVNLFPMNNIMIKTEPPSSPEMTTPMFDNPTPKESPKSDQKSCVSIKTHRRQTRVVIQTCKPCKYLENLNDFERRLRRSIARRVAHSRSKCYQLESLLDDIQNLKDRILSLVKDLGNATKENEKEGKCEPVCVECIPLD
ncbi:hypothetical protein L484_005629 [Morus notabilis]|uniref:Uncharacterized protein n=1 Tax=Morus notabilis TaxID=981085 RepID=W9SFM5_9ROSA|nr:hypothetical protein L484_005629 [Morus notabilis]